MDEAELKKLSDQHGGEIRRVIRTHKGTTYTFGVFRRISYDEAAKFEDADPVLMHRDAAELCLLWPSVEEWREKVSKRPLLSDSAFQAIAEVSGEQFEVRSDFEACTVEALDGDQVVLSSGCIALAEYQRFGKDAKKSSLAAGRAALINTATHPANRDDVVAFIDRYPFIIDPFLREVFEISGASVDIKGK